MNPNVDHFVVASQRMLFYLLNCHSAGTDTALMLLLATGIRSLLSNLSLIAEHGVRVLQMNTCNPYPAKLACNSKMIL